MREIIKNKEQRLDILKRLSNGELTPDQADKLLNNISKQMLVEIIRQYQRSCEIMHVNKIDAKSFVDHL